MSGHRRTARRGLRAAVGIGFVVAGVVLAVTGAAGATGDEETITAARGTRDIETDVDGDLVLRLPAHTDDVDASTVRVDVRHTPGAEGRIHARADVGDITVSTTTTRTTP